jgi:ribosomal protein S18 acetylase RimI-like enzyme
VTVKRLYSPAELLDLAPDVAYVRAEIVPGVDGDAWVHPDAVGFMTTWKRLSQLSCVGEPDAAVAVALAALADLPERPRWVTLPRGAHELLPDGLPYEHADDWDFRWTTSPPPAVPAEELVSALAGADEEVTALLDVASPRRSVDPGDPTVRRWAGVRDASGRLVACGAELRRRPAGLADLASIATHPDVRGQGLGTALTAWLTRRVLAEGDPMCTLGVYADNLVARRLYTRLGYIDDPTHWFSSVRLT